MKATMVKIGLTLLIYLAVCPAEAQKKIKHKLYKTYWYEVDYNGIKEAWSKEKKVLIPQSLGCTEIDYQYDALLVKTKSGFIGLYDIKNGAAIIDPNQFIDLDYYRYPYLKAKTQDGKMCLIKYSGRIMFPPKAYDDLRENFWDKAYVTVVKNQKEGVCDTLGHEIVTPIWETIYGPQKSEGVSYYCAKDVVFHLLDDEGSVIYSDKSGQYTGLELEICNDTRFIKARKGEKYDILDMNGNVIISLERYDTAWPRYEHEHIYFYVKKNGLEGVCNSNGVEIIPLRYKNIFYSDSSNEFILKEVNRPELYINSGISLNDDFEVAKPSTYTESYFKELSKATISQIGGKFFLECSGAKLTKRLYDALVYDEAEQMYYGQLNGYATAITEEGKEVSPIGKQIFDEAYSLGDEYAQDKLDLYFLLLNIDPNNLDGYNASAYNNIGVIFRNAGDDNTALTYYERALAIDPSNQTAKGNIKTIKAECRAERLNNIANALGQMSEALGNMNAVQGGGSYGAYQGSGSSSSGSTSRTRAKRHCTNCAGTGNCPKCRGNGQILGKIDQEFRCCPICNPNCSAPRDKKGKCTRCGGTGVK